MSVFDGLRCLLSWYVRQVFLLFFFFSSRRRHTRLQGDWSSDVCSSDLRERGAHARREIPRRPVPASRPAPRRACDQGSGDRKSTRLNSSHLVISYAVFCLKKKKRLISS